MITWIEKRFVIAIHERQIAEHGGDSGVRDETLLESALARPQQLYAYGDPALDLADLAASLAFGIARNHPFVDGNKRTALLALVTFLGLNGIDFVASEAEAVVIIRDLAAALVSEENLARWIRDNLPPQSPQTA